PDEVDGVGVWDQERVAGKGRDAGLAHIVAVLRRRGLRQRNSDETPAVEPEDTPVEIVVGVVDREEGEQHEVRTIDRRDALEEHEFLVVAVSTDGRVDDLVATDAIALGQGALQDLRARPLRLRAPRKGPPGAA